MYFFLYFSFLLVCFFMDFVLFFYVSLSVFYHYSFFISIIFLFFGNFVILIQFFFVYFCFLFLLFLFSCCFFLFFKDFVLLFTFRFLFLLSLSIPSFFPFSFSSFFFFGNFLTFLAPYRLLFFFSIYLSFHKYQICKIIICSDISVVFIFFRINCVFVVYINVIIIVLITRMYNYVSVMYHLLY